MLFAREETFIGLNLATASSIASAGAGASVTLDFDGHTSTTFASVSWAPYRYNSANGPDGKVIGWEQYPLVEYWDKMEAQFTEAFRNLPAEANPYRDNASAIVGEMLVARSLFMTFYKGLSNLVQAGSTNAGVQFDVLLTWSSSGDAETDVGIAEGVGGLLVGSYWIISDFVSDFADTIAKAWMAQARLNTLAALPFAQAPAVSKTEFFLQSQGEGWKGVKTAWLDTFNPSSLFVTINNVDNVATKGSLGAGSVIAISVAAAAVVACIAAAALSEGDPMAIIGYVVQAIAIVVQLKGTLDAIKKAADVISGIEEIVTISKYMKSLSGKLSAAGYILGAVVTWAVFAVQAALSDLSYQDMGNLVAQTIGQTIVLVIMFCIELIPIVGAIISGIVQLIDALISTVCAIFGLDQEAPGDRIPTTTPATGSAAASRVWWAPSWAGSSTPATRWWICRPKVA